MRKLNKEEIEVFKEVIQALDEQDLELVEAFALDKETTDRLDCINLLVFRSFNTIITKRDVLDIVSKFNDSEFASFSVHQVEDVYTIYGVI